uniref:Uncharacterized protein n=1 Tax=Cacopsylla melanoneura TaxID=428564 RepID=A0A8D8MAH5_9HEMI
MVTDLLATVTMRTDPLATITMVTASLATVTMVTDHLAMATMVSLTTLTWIVQRIPFNHLRDFIAVLPRKNKSRQIYVNYLLVTTMCTCTIIIVIRRICLIVRTRTRNQTKVSSRR